jgi:uncharacterized protein (DUF1697 family)
MTFKIQVKKHRPVNVTLARYLPQFATEFENLRTIVASGPVATTSGIASQEIVDGVEITIEESFFATQEEATAGVALTATWPHDDIIAYNQANNVLTYNRIVNVETNEVIQDWTQRW